MSREQATEPTTGSVAIAEVLADMTEAEQTADPDALAHSDDLLDGIAKIEQAIADQLPPGLWRATQKFDRTRLDVPFDLPDLQFDAWDVESARELAKHLPWAEGEVREYVQKGLHYDFYTWAGRFCGVVIWVIGPQELPTATPRWWSKPEANETTAGETGE